MMIDKIGGVGPGYGPKKTENTSKAEGPKVGTDNVVISSEAARAAETARIARIASSSEDQTRVERLKEIKTKLSNGDYNNLSEDVLDKVAGSISETFFG